MAFLLQKPVCVFQDAFATLFDFEISENGINAGLKIIKASRELLQSRLHLCILYWFYLNIDFKKVMRQHGAPRKQDTMNPI